MRATDAQWGDVAVDTYIQDRSGKAWRVVEVDDRHAGGGRTGHFLCKSRAGEITTITPKLETEHVTLLVPTEDDLIPLLRDRLGAEVLATKDHATGEITCPAWPERANGIALDAFRSHLTLSHGMYVTDVKMYKGLQEAHEAAHDPDQPTVGKLMSHTHN